MADMYITEILINSVLLLNPATALISLTGTGSVGSILNLGTSILDPASVVSAVGNTITNPFVEIWNWILYNIISPLLIVIFTILFFVGQYYLIKLYIYIVKNGIVNIAKGGAWITQNKKLVQKIDNIATTILE